MKNWKAILGVLGVFVLGALAGALVVHRVYQRRIHAFIRGGPAATEMIVRRLNGQLDLPPDQRAQVETIVRESRQKLRETRQQIDPQVHAVFQDMDQRVRELLTSDQRVKFDKLVAERKAKWAQFHPPPAAPPPPAN